MALEDRIRMSVNQALEQLVAELVSSGQAEFAREVAASEQRLQDEFNQKIAEFEESQRRQTAEEVRAAVEAEAARVSAEAEARHAADLQAAVEAAAAVKVADAQARLTALDAEAAQRLSAQEAEFEARSATLRRDFDERLSAAVAEAEARAATDTEATLAAARAGERELEIAGMVRLADSIRGLDGASSLSEVLDALALAAARETARAAVMVVKADRLIGWRLAGFGARDAQPKAIDMAVKEAGVAGLAATSSRAAATREGEADGPGFEHLPADRKGFAMPVLVGGRVVAVLYADGVTSPAQAHVVPSPWPEVIEILARHAGKCLEALTAQKEKAATSQPGAAGAPRRAGAPTTAGAAG